VSAVLNDYRTAPIDEKVRATLALLEKITLEPDQVGVQDLERLRKLHLAEQAIENALHVCVLFNIIDRVAHALGFEVPAPDVSAFGAKLSLSVLMLERHASASSCRSGRMFAPTGEQGDAFTPAGAGVLLGV